MTEAGNERRGPRLARSRVGTAVALTLTGLLLVTLLGERAAHWVRDFVRDQPVYHHDFSAITFDPPPPLWIRPGREGLLAQILKDSKHPQDESLMTRDLEAVGRDCLQNPWIRQVERVERVYPNRLVVRIPPKGYREPVAKFPTGTRPKGLLALDEEGVVLPTEDLDWSKAGKILQLDGFENLRLADKHPGRLLRFLATAEGEPEVDPRVLDAARFAGLLKSRLDQDSPPFEPLSLRLVQGKGFWTWTSAGYYIIWGEAEDPSKLDARWKRVRDWLAENPPPRRDSGQSLDASDDHVRLVQIPLAGPSGNPGPGASH